MRFFAVFLLFAVILAVTARNVPQLTPEQAAEFNEQQIQSGKRSLQDAVHEWLNPDKVCSSVIRFPENSGCQTLYFITSPSHLYPYSPQSLLALFPPNPLLHSPLFLRTPNLLNPFRNTIPTPSY